MRSRWRSEDPVRFGAVWVLAVLCVVHFVPSVVGLFEVPRRAVKVQPAIQPRRLNPLPVNDGISESEIEREKYQMEKEAEKENSAFGTGYLVIAPKIMCAGGREKVFLTFADFRQPIDVQMAVMENEEETLAITKMETFSTPCGCMELDLPYIDGPRKIVNLYLYAKRSLMQCEEFEIVKKVKIFLDACYSDTFIETDKPIYKPGQTVQFRVLTLLPDLRPDLSEVSKMWIESPAGIHMAQWLNVGSKQGLIDMSMLLSTDPPMGDWKIKIRHHDREFLKTFEVGEYVLPKFEVMVLGPDFVMVNAKEFNVTVCGRYTHGQPVKGTIELQVSISNKPDRSVADKTDTTDRNGCYIFKIDTKSLKLMQTGYNVYSAKLLLKASFTETTTQQVIEKTNDQAVISNLPFKLKFSVPSTFKPGLSFSGMLLFTDPSDKPLSHTDAVVVVKTGNAIIFSEKVTSDSKGIAYFTIADVPSSAIYINLGARAKGYAIRANYKTKPYTRGISDPRANENVQPQFSPSNSFLHIDPITKAAKVDTFQRLTIHLTSDKPEYNGVYLHTVLMSRGNILLAVESIIPPEEIDGFRSPGAFGVYPVKVDALGRKERPDHKNMKVTDIPVNILDKGKVKITRRKIEILYEMAPAVTVMVYYIRDDGEVIADTITIPVEEVFQNEVEVKFTEKKKRPGDETVLKVRAKKSSLCAYGVVDKSVHLLGGDNRITKEKVFEALEKLQLSSEGGSAEPPRCGGPGGHMRGINPIPQKNMPDASQAFKDLGVVYMTNLKVDTAPCPKHVPYHYMMRDNLLARPVMMMMKGEQQLETVAFDNNDVGDGGGEGVQIRSYFPETWLYSLVEMEDDGQSDIKVTVPHTITEWIGHGFCTSTKYGAGVSNLTSLTAFQTFFVDMTLPYSVIRNEIVPVTVDVFNYISKCLMVDLTLQASNSFEIDGEDRVENLCVCAGESKSASFYIKTTELGTIPVEVHALSTVVHVCHGRIHINARKQSDGIKKNLLVKPEGVETEHAFSTFFCPKDYPEGNYVQNILLQDLPSNYVVGSERGVITLTGDMLGPSIDNLDKLLRMPTGCGEQNMLGMVPNIFVLHYLTGINKLSAAIEAKAKEHMKIGYQRELTYRHKDGSYSAFGESDPSGSTWLTAFVVRSFSQASKYIYIDPVDLNLSKKWLMDLQQKDDGCFKLVGKVIHKDMMGNVNDVATLTAYVIISLIEAGDAFDAPHIKRGVECLNKKVDIKSADMYTLAIAGYAFILAGIPHRDDLLHKLNELAVESGGLTHWAGPLVLNTHKRPVYLHQQSSSQSIEITSYVLLIYIRAYEKSQSLVKGNPVARWIVSQRNTEGGFSSTQDTVMALQALAEYSMVAHKDGKLDITLEVKFSCEDHTNSLQIDEINSLILQTMKIPQVPVEIDMSATGQGCAMTQVIVRYNVVPEEQTEPPFTVSFHTEEEKVFSTDHCTSYIVTICAKYNGKDKVSNMAVIQVRMVSGFDPDATNIRLLKASKSPDSPQRIEQEGKDVFFYFNQISVDTCVSFMVKRDKYVREPKDGVITVYDYYEKTLSVSKTYNFECQSASKVIL